MPLAILSAWLTVGTIFTTLITTYDLSAGRFSALPEVFISFFVVMLIWPIALYSIVADYLEG
jgi:hypothetical protein